VEACRKELVRWHWEVDQYSAVDSGDHVVLEEDRMLGALEVEGNWVVRGIRKLLVEAVFRIGIVAVVTWRLPKGSRNLFGP